MNAKEHMDDKMLPNITKRAIFSIILVLIVVFAFFTQVLQFFPYVVATVMFFELNMFLSKNKKIIISSIIYVILFVLSNYYAAKIVKNIDSFVLFNLLIVWIIDVFAYFGGCIIGGPKLMPRVSPNKTISGACCGIFAAMAVMHFFSVLAWHTVLLLGLAAIAGDLLESKAKRLLNIKDMSNIIPGHGGFCDRFDSFSLVSIIHTLIVFFTNIQKSV